MVSVNTNLTVNLRPLSSAQHQTLKTLKKFKLLEDDELFCGMVDRRKAFSLISSRDHCQRSLPSRTSDTAPTGFEPVQNLSSGVVE